MHLHIFSIYRHQDWPLCLPEKGKVIIFSEVMKLPVVLTRVRALLAFFGPDATGNSITLLSKFKPTIKIWWLFIKTTPLMMQFAMHILCKSVYKCSRSWMSSCWRGLWVTLAGEMWSPYLLSWTSCSQWEEDRLQSYQPRTVLLLLLVQDIPSYAPATSSPAG